MEFFSHLWRHLTVFLRPLLEDRAHLLHPSRQFRIHSTSARRRNLQRFDTHGLPFHERSSRIKHNDSVSDMSNV